MNFEFKIKVFLTISLLMLSGCKLRKEPIEVVKEDNVSSPKKIKSYEEKVRDTIDSLRIIITATRIDSLQTGSFRTYKEWEKTFSGKFSNELKLLQETSDGGYILGGDSDSGIGGDKTEASRGKGTNDFWLVKIDANGKKQWDKTLGGSGYESLQAMQQTSDGGYILGGWSQSGKGGDKSQPLSGESDYWLVKVDANGKKEWDKTFGGNKIEHLHAIQQTPDGGFIVGGSSGSGISGDKSQELNGTGYSDYWIVRLDNKGNKLWDKSYGGNNSDYLTFLLQTSDGGYLLAGDSSSEPSTDKTEAEAGLWLIKVDANGNKLWDKLFGGKYEYRLEALQETAKGDFVLGGQTSYRFYSFKHYQKQDSAFMLVGEKDYWLMTLDSKGNKIWETAFGSNQDDRLVSLQQIPDGYLVGGYSDFKGKKEEDRHSNGFTLIKLDKKGNKKWYRTFAVAELPKNNLPRWSTLRSFKPTSDGGYILGGNQITFDNEYIEDANMVESYWVIKLKSGAVNFEKD